MPLGQVKRYSLQVPTQNMGCGVCSMLSFTVAGHKAKSYACFPLFAPSKWYLSASCAAWSWRRGHVGIVRMSFLPSSMRLFLLLCHNKVLISLIWFLSSYGRYFYMWIVVQWMFLWGTITGESYSDILLCPSPLHLLRPWISFIRTL